MANYRYYLGPWKWIDNGPMPHYAPPVGAIGSLDLGTIPEMSVGGADRPRGLFWTPNDAPLDSAYVELATGDCREINSSGSLVSKFQSELGVSVEGDKLVDLIFDCFIGGSDPDGEEAAKPLVPTVAGELELWMPGHSRTKFERFQWGVHRQTARLQAMLRKEFDGLMADAKGGKLKDDKHHLRVLDYWCDKYRAGDWKDFVSAKSQKDVPGRLKHETTINESFIKADSTTLGPDLTWTETATDWDVFSNTVRLNTAGAGKDARAEHDLSSSDHYTQLVVSSLSSGAADLLLGPTARFNASARTYYSATPYQADDKIYLSKASAGTMTDLISVAITMTIPGTFRIICNGSALSVLQDAVQRISTTDSSISGNLRTGIRGYYASVKPQGSAFEAGDLSTATASPLGGKLSKLFSGKL